MKRAIMAIAVAAALLITASFTGINAGSAYASTKEKLDEANEEVENIQNSISSTQGELDEASSKLTSLLMAQSALAAEIEANETEIEEVKVELEEAKAQQEAQYAVMKTRIQYMYENSGSSILATILDSKSLSEILNKVEYMSTVYNYDQNLLNAYQLITEQVASLEATLEADLKEKQELKASYDTQQAQLESLTATLSAQMSDYESQLSEAQSLASQYQTDRKSTRLNSSH